VITTIILTPAVDLTQREPLHFGASGQFFSSYNARERITLYTI
jgi:hypothetical protein